MNSLYPFIYNAFFIASAITLIIGIFTKTLGAFIAGYCVLGVGIMMLLLVLFANVLQTYDNQSVLYTLFALLSMSGAFLLLLGIVGFLLYQTIYYKYNVVSGLVAPRYQTFNNVTVALLLVQLWIMIRNTSTESFITTGRLSKLTTSLLYCIGTLAAISAINQYTILTYYSTDGFQLIQP